MVDDLEVPTGMGLIIRTAGANRNKSEIKRDYEFLLRSWDSVRDLTLKSTAPTMVYEEANLIKRTIRDLYSKDIEEVLVEGEEAYKAAKKFMRMLMPSHAKRVQPYRDPVPLFHRYQVEERFDTMHATEVRLKGGGYIVINPTEALVAVDVNSGKSTKERNIEETALRTNLEAAEELARHLRLRDLGGLIVIDFIDMNENRHNRAVERCIKEALQQDRARIQIGRISSFGLLEMSRQRMRPSLFEASSEPCSHCHGTGSVRSRESTALHVLRAIETEGIKKPGGDLTVSVAMPVAIYLLNQKRSTIAEIEKRHAMRVFIIGDETLVPPEIRIERTASTIEVVPERPVQIVEIDEDLDEISAIETNEETAPIDGEDDGQRGKRRRRGRRGGHRSSKRAPTDEALDGGVNENDQDSNQANAPTQEDQANPEVMGEAAVAQVEPPHATVDSVAAGDPDDTDIVVDHSQYEGTADSPDVADATASDAVLPAAEWHNPVPRDGSESLAVTDESSDSSEGASVMPISDADLAVVAEAIENDDQQPRKSRRGWWRRATE
ncbi:MAG: ribonuclease E/G [Proteobacteria bacterium]|nr:ribonuclease E/G [Pseudomonadota bacterium]